MWIWRWISREVGHFSLLNIQFTDENPVAVVWKPDDQSELVLSLMQNYPVFPAIPHANDNHDTKY